MLLFLKILVGLSVVVLIVGLIKPNWICFWMKEPNRIAVSTIAMLMFMGAWTGIAKMTMKPREKVPEQHRSVEDQNELQLDNR
jgi:uncharacterized membrane protein YqjE